MTQDITVYEPSQGGAVSTQSRQAESDDHLVSIWLHGRSAHTQRAYGADVADFRAVLGKSLQLATVGDIQAYADTLEGRGLSPASRGRKLSTVKSLMTFAQRIGYLTFNPGAAVRQPAKKNDLAARIMTEEAALKMLALEEQPRNRAILRLLYGSGIRVSELTALCWKDLQARDSGGQITVFGKGGKTRAIVLSQATYDELLALGQGEPEEPVFRSRKGGNLDESQVFRIIQEAAKRAGIRGNVSPHWLRHAHASHALDRGAPIHLVQATLGHASVSTTGRYTHARPSESSARFLSV